MAGFLRKKTTLKRTTLPAQRRSDDAPPLLPPLLLSPPLAEPAPLPPTPSLPVLPVSVHEPLILDDAWNPWSEFRLDSQSRPPHVTGQKHDPPSQPNRDILQSGNDPQSPVNPNKRLSTVATPTTKSQKAQPSNRSQPKQSPAVVRGQPPTHANFDFEESLSAANVTSVVNQFRSFPSIRPHTSPHMDTRHPPPSLPQKSGSTSSHSSSSRNTDATQKSYPTSTSASSLSAPRVIDSGKSVGSLLHSFNADRSTSRPSTSPRVHRPPLPPTSYPERRTLARQNSQSDLERPMLFDMLRSGNPDFTPLRKGPLIFAAVTTNPYPSPPAEPSPVAAHARRKSSVSSGSHGHRVSAAFDDATHLARKSSKGNLASSAGTEHARRVLTKARPTTPQKPAPQPSLPEPGNPLLLDDDPFARVEGVKMLKPRSSTPSSCCTSLRDGISEDGHVPPLPNDLAAVKSPLTPPDDYKAARQQRRGQWLEKAPPPVVADVVAKQLAEESERQPTPPPTYFPILAFMSDANLLPVLLSFLSYSEWLALYSANRQIRELFQSRILREFVLERFLSTVGYAKWNYEWAEPLELSLKDLHDYLRGVAMPTHQYARLANAYLQPKVVGQKAPTTSDTPDILALALTTRSYTRLVLRLRAQAESEARYLKTLQARHPTGPGTRQPSVSSRAPSPTSSYSHSRNHSHGKNENSSSSALIPKFRSSLYRPGRAPVLRVFVPSPEGDWLSDAGVVECEAELKRSGVLKLLRVGDIVWDVAVGDEGNLGRLIWDGSYLVDLDYRYSRVGELSPYFHSLAFSPSYFHRVIRIGGSASHNPHCNPIVYIDVSAWGREIAANLQLLQDRARTETPHGALHDVVRWVHRSTFTIRPPQNRSRPTRVPIPNVDGHYIDSGWYGTVVLESEGTHEGLADLQSRCGPGVFPPRAESLATKMRNEKERENKRVWRILREKSRPGEIWLRAVQAKERLM